MKRKEKLLLALLFLGIFILIFSVLSQKSTTGNVIEGTSIKNTLACSDTDGGVFESQKGILTRKNFLGITTTYIDVCSTVPSDEQTLIERYCESDRAKSERMFCIHGCDKGICKNPLFIEKCFIQLKISEEVKDQSIAFLLLETKNVYGQYDSQVQIYTPNEPSENILKTKDEQGNVLSRYHLPSSRFIVSEDFSGADPQGEVIQVQRGTFESTIPYDTRIRKIVVESEGKEKDLNLDPTLLSCSRTCKTVGESIDLKQERCCYGLIPAEQQDNTFVCTNCGDGLCSPLENKYSCAEDCKP